MNQSKITLAIAAIVAAAALATVAFAVPQVMAYRHHNHNNNNNSIKVDQQISQANVCSGQSPESGGAAAVVSHPAESNTTCVNVGSNSADIGH